MAHWKVTRKVNYTNGTVGRSEIGEIEANDAQLALILASRLGDVGAFEDNGTALRWGSVVYRASKLPDDYTPAPRSRGGVSRLTF